MIGRINNHPNFVLVLKKGPGTVHTPKQTKFVCFTRRKKNSDKASWLIILNKVLKNFSIWWKLINFHTIIISYIDFHDFFLFRPIFLLKPSTSKAGTVKSSLISMLLPLFPDGPSGETIVPSPSVCSKAIRQ